MNILTFIPITMTSLLLPTARPIMCATLDDALFQSLLRLTQGLNTNNVMQVTTM